MKLYHFSTDDGWLELIEIKICVKLTWFIIKKDVKFNVDNVLDNKQSTNK